MQAEVSNNYLLPTIQFVTLHTIYLENDFHVNCIQRSFPTSQRTQPDSTVKTSMKEVQGEKE